MTNIFENKPPGLEEKKNNVSSSWLDHYKFRLTVPIEGRGGGGTNHLPNVLTEQDCTISFELSLLESSSSPSFVLSCVGWAFCLRLSSQALKVEDAGVMSIEVAYSVVR